VTTTTLNSSLISEATYNAQTSTMTITLQNGKVYSYSKVPESTYRGLIGASSAGQFFNAKIAKRFETSQIV
jgi:hypothetical protein